MASTLHRPCTNAHFLVDLGTRSTAMGFAEVVFPDFRLEDGARMVLLRRGADGALDLYRWWDQARRGKAPKRRTVKVQLLADDQATVVLTWVFRNVVPRALSYSPLNANEGAVLMETIELAFDTVEMA
jgi:phage tail-like protein